MMLLLELEGPAGSYGPRGLVSQSARAGHGSGDAGPALGLAAEQVHD